MKNTKFGRWITTMALISTSAAFAGETYVDPGPVTPPPPPPSLWTWFIGGSVNEVEDWDEQLYTFHIGMEKTSGVNTHAFFLEIGWAGDDGSVYDPINSGIEPPKIDIDLDIIPVTLNYKFERPLFGSERISWYAGLGLGVLFTDLDLDYDAGRMGRSSGGSDERFFGQGFLGLVWNVTENFEIYGGGRWMYVDTDDDFDIDDNTKSGEIGVRFNF